MPSKLTTEQFIERAKAVHGDVYDYSQSVCTGSHNKITIICREHGAFEQIAKSHMAGRGCSQCGDLRAGAAISLGQDGFIKKALAVHGSRYDYSKSVYKKAHDHVIIICPDHGEFKQTPSSHFTGKGCRKCSDAKNGFKKRNDVNELISRFKELHADKYDYSKVNYRGNKQKIEIICKEHGSFKQIPSDHLRGIGCPKCGRKKAMEANRLKAPGWSVNSWGRSAINSNNFDSFKLYLVLCGNSETGEYFLKVGRTFLQLKDRFDGFPYEWKELHTLCSDASEVCKVENKLKSKYKELRVIPSKSFSGKHECFSITALDGLMTEFEKLNKQSHEFQQ